MFAQPYEGLEMYRPPIVPQINGVVNPMRAYSGNALGLGLKAIDMGCSKVVRSGTALTKRMGTPAYFAPEVFLRSYTPMADLWSTGVLAHQLLTGRFPFWKDLRGLSTQDVADCVIHETVKYPEAHWYKTPPDARDFTAALLQKDPEKRMTAEEALQHPWIQRHLKSVRAAHDHQ
jgi:calcium-dependent protein kinase